MGELAFPDVALESLRKGFPFLRCKPKEMESLRKALIRLSWGELDGKAMEEAEAIAFLRGRIQQASIELRGREKRFTPHLTTWLNQSRYLNAAIEQAPPANLEDAISILECYPTVMAVDVKAHMPVLRVIDSHIEYFRPTHGDAAASYIRVKVKRYAECVARWDTSELQFVPSPMKFFAERRYEQRQELWVRTPKNGFQSERSQIARLIQ